jgi:DNA-binding NtrC family response regulator/tetratricopeptide (TPR) repeat protein
LKRALDLAGENDPVKMNILTTMSLTLSRLGRLDESVDCIARGLRFLWKSPGRPRPSSMVYTSLGHACLGMGQIRKAMRWYLAGKRTSDRFGFLLGSAGAGNGLAIAAWAVGMPALAVAEAWRAEEISRTVGDTSLLSSVLGCILSMANAAGRHDFFLEKRKEAKALLGLPATPPGMASFVFFPEISFFIRAGRLEEARETFDNSLPSLEKTELAARVKIDQAKMELALDAGSPDEALAIAVSAEEEKDRPGFTLPILRLAKGRALLDLGRPGEAGELLRAEMDRCAKNGLDGEVPDFRFQAARCAMSEGRFPKAFSEAERSAEEAGRAGRAALVWQALRLAGLSQEALGRRRRAAKFFRRAAWAMEAEAMAFPEPYRSSFANREDVADLAKRLTTLRAEETAARAARLIGRKILPGGGGWEETAVSWARRSSAFLGADAVVFRPGWPEATPSEAVFGKPLASDDTWTLELGEGGIRTVFVTLHRRWERGPLFPVAKRMAPILGSDLFLLLERGEWLATVARLERSRRSLRDRVRDGETALVTARRTLAQTQEALGRARGYGEMVGVTPEMQEIYNLIKRWAPKDVSVLVTGESGTGKELVARGIHAESPRHDGPFFAVNCSAVAEPLLESELFGYEKGAFTGAEETRPGFFELASDGSLVLDEVADMSPRMQAQVLRVLEERKVRRVGGGEKISVNVRVIALTNRPLDVEVEQGRFRMDLFHRLNQATIELPPLRKRKGDIPLLAEYFLALAREGEVGKRTRLTRISRSLAAKLVGYRWPGNVRELKNQVQRAVVLAGKRALTPQDFPDIGTRKVTQTGLESDPLYRLRKTAADAAFSLERRHEELLRLMLTGASVKRSEYEEMAGISTATAWRDLERLISTGILEKSGRGRATVYRISPKTLASMTRSG